MQVDIEEVLRMYHYRKSINKSSLQEIEWYWRGEKVEVTKEEVEFFDYTGLSNTDFIVSGAIPSINNLPGFTEEFGEEGNKLIVLTGVKK